MKKSVISGIKDRIVSYYDFGAVDKRGRAVGCRIVTATVGFKAAPDAFVYGYHALEPGVYYSLNVWATRGGKTFGAIQPDRYFPTKAKRDAAIKAYLAGARKRASHK